MADLLIHSLAEFAEIIVPALKIAEVKTVGEIGVESGAMTQQLIEYTRAEGGKLISIDPDPSNQAQKLFDGEEHATLIEDVSLNALSSFVADAYLVDGDHNYYTVFNESQLIWEQVQKADKHFLVFYHDVAWPCGRRDQYCDPDRIPTDYLQPYVWDKGLTLDNPGVIEGGFRGEGRWACAAQDGGPRNGVLTAIEDFVQGKDDLCWAVIPAVFGLGILFDHKAPWADELAQLLLPYHMNPLIARLERNRLDCYLGVLARQDQLSAAAV